MQACEQTLLHPHFLPSSAMSGDRSLSTMIGLLNLGLAVFLESFPSGFRDLLATRLGLNSLSSEFSVCQV